MNFKNIYVTILRKYLLWICVQINVKINIFPLSKKINCRKHCETSIGNIPSESTVVKEKYVYVLQTLLFFTASFKLLAYFHVICGRPRQQSRNNCVGPPASPSYAKTLSPTQPTPTILPKCCSSIVFRLLDYDYM